LKNIEKETSQNSKNLKSNTSLRYYYQHMLLKLLRDIDIFADNEEKQEWFEKINENNVDIDDQMK
jgi:hypothetical protein